MLYKFTYYDKNTDENVEVKFEAKSDKAACNECERIVQDKRYSDPILVLAEDQEVRP